MVLGAMENANISIYTITSEKQHGRFSIILCAADDKRFRSDTKYYELTKEGGMNFAYTKNGR